MDQDKRLIKKLQVPRHVVVTTLERLQRSGSKQHEGVVLWLGVRFTDPMQIKSVYEPTHQAADGYFHIPPHGMEALMEQLDRQGLSVLSQVHTHPREAFHSRADDHRALVRHLGALSLVLPYFANTTTPENFLRMVAAFTLNRANQWVLVPQGALGNALEFVP